MLVTTLAARCQRDAIVIDTPVSDFSAIAEEIFHTPI